MAKRFYISGMENKGFGLVEVILVMVLVGVILLYSFPRFQAMQQEGLYTKVERELETLRAAVTSYWRHHGQSYPSNIYSDLTNAVPAIITKKLNDPWNTDATNNTYGYKTGTDSTFGDYFIIYTKGPDGDTDPVFSAANQRVEYSGSGRVVSNAPVSKQ